MGLRDGPAENAVLAKALQDQVRLLRSLGQNAAADAVEAKLQTLLPPPAQAPAATRTASASSGSWVPWAIGAGLVGLGLASAYAVKRWGGD